MKREKGPKRSRLRKAIITLLGTPEYESQSKLKAQIRKLYVNIPVTEVDSAVETLLLELEQDGAIQLKPDNCVVLTESGRQERESQIARTDYKRRKKSGQIDLKIKREETEKKKKTSKDVHDQLKLELGKLAVMLGKTWGQEYQLIKGGPVVLDLVWYRKSNQMGISHAFEVQHRGDWKNAIGNLEAVNRRYPECKLFILVFNEKRIKPIHDLLGGKMNTSIKVIKVSRLRTWLGVLGQVPDKARSQIIYIIDDMRGSGIIK